MSEGTKELDQLVRENEALRHRVAELEAEARRLEATPCSIGDGPTGRVRDEERNLATLQSIGDGVISTDASGRVTQMNPTAQALTGWGEAEALGQPLAPVFRIVNEETRAAVESPVDRVLREGKVVGLANHTVLIAKDGAERPIADSGAPIRNTAGDVTGVVLVFRDQSEKRRAEKEVAVAQERFRTFFDNAPIGKCMTAPDGKLVRVNAAFVGMLGYSIEEMQTISFVSITHPEDLAESRECVRALLAGERDTWVMEKRYLAKDGHHVWTQVTTRLQRDEKQRPLHFLTHILDITERKVAEEKIRTLNKELDQRVVARTVELTAANKELEAFAYSVSHDLRAPLRGIDGFSKALSEDYQDKLDATAIDYINRVRAGTQRMGMLIDDLLKLSRMTRAEMHHQHLDLGELGRKIALELQHDDPDRRVDFEVSHGLTARGDRALLQAALENLLRNAWKFTGHREHARIELGVTEHAGERVYYVRDDGAGFDMAYVDKLFGPFQRLHDTTEFPGSGIGLAIVQRVILRHGGRIWAEGEVDKGATFYFTLSSTSGNTGEGAES
jgi:PAS domain S-box-containing protein